jgi:hypothetical protein
MSRITGWVRTNYGWGEKRRDYLTLIIVVSVLVVAALIMSAVIELVG